MKRKLNWLICNGGMAAIAWAAVNGSEGAGRVLVFLVWVFTIVQLVTLRTPEIRSEIKAKGRSVPRWMTETFDLALSLYLIWHGWWWTGAAVFIILLTTSAIHADTKKGE